MSLHIVPDPTPDVDVFRLHAMARRGRDPLRPVTTRYRWEGTLESGEREEGFVTTTELSRWLDGEFNTSRWLYLRVFSGRKQVAGIQMLDDESPMAWCDAP